MSVFWISFLVTIATAALLVRLFFLYSEYVKLNVSRLPHKTEDLPEAEKQQDSSKNETEKTTDNQKSRPAKKKTVKKKTAKKSKKKKN